MYTTCFSVMDVPGDRPRRFHAMLCACLVSSLWRFTPPAEQTDIHTSTNSFSRATNYTPIPGIAPNLPLPTAATGPGTGTRERWPPRRLRVCARSWAACALLTSAKGRSAPSSRQSSDSTQSELARASPAADSFSELYFGIDWGSSLPHWSRCLIVLYAT